MQLQSKDVATHMQKKLHTILPKVAGTHNVSSTDGLPPIDLSVAENLLLRDELLDFAKDAIAKNLKPEHLSYPPGFGGDPELLEALATFFNTYFHPSTPVQPGQIVTVSGAGNALDALLCSICDDGDSVLVPGPYWEGFGPYFRIHANVNIRTVHTPTFDGSMDFGMVAAVKDAYNTAPAPSRIRALVLTNPHNPFGQCYPPEVLRELMRFCQAHDLHLISDEVYALSSFKSSSTLPPFVSALSLLSNLPETDIEGRHRHKDGFDPARVHVIWSLSKDFGCSGIRMGCVISQANQMLLTGVGLSAYWQTSALSSVVATSLLNSPSLPDLVRLNQERLAESYAILTESLIKWQVEFLPANAGLFVFAKVAEDARDWEEETAIVGALASSGVIVSPGRRFDGGESEKGWVRITFAVPRKQLVEALERVEPCLHLSRRGAEAQR